MRKDSYYSQVWGRFKKNHLAVAGMCIAVIMGFIAVAAPIIANNKPIVARNKSGKIVFPFLNSGLTAESEEYTFKINPVIPYGPTEYELDDILIPPSKRHILGTDDRGRDIASRLIHGARTSLSIGFVAVFIYVFIGLILGSFAGYFGKKVDMVISRLVEIMICFPTFFLIIIIIAYLPSSMYNIMAVIGLTGWTGVARLIRGEIFKIKNIDYVSSAQALGVSSWRVVSRHILPNAIGPVLVSATFGIAGAILIESALSYLGFGVQPPTPSWGEILLQAKKYLSWWLVIFPGLAIFITITSFNLVGEGLRDAIDPKFSK